MKTFSFKEVAPCLFAILIDILGFGLVAPLLVVLFTSSDNHIFSFASSTSRYLVLGIALALYPLCMFVGSSVIGDLSDVIGRKKTLLFSMLGMAFSLILMSIGVIFSSLTLFLVGRGLSGLVSASQSVALATISDLSTKENKAVHLSYVALVQCIGFVVGPLLGGVLSGTTFYAPFLWSAFFALISFFWIAFSFEETFHKNKEKEINLLRCIKIFSEAYQNKKIRKLSVVFFTMQIGVGLYLPVILILLTTHFNYSSLFLGLFNGYLGIGFALGLLFVLPLMVKRLKIEQIVWLTLVIASLSQFFSSLFHSETLIWALGFLFAVAIEIAFSGMFTSFSNAADENSQGWAMGISVAVMAIAWAFAGLSAQLIPLFGIYPLIFLGSLFLGASSLLMKNYSNQFQ